MTKKLFSKNINTIINNDCLNELMEYPSNSIDLIITSPPYADKRKKSYKGKKAKEYVNWFLPISEQMYRILKPRGSFILNIKEHSQNGEKDTYVIELILELKKQGWLWIEEYCWYKKNSFPGKWPNRFRDAWERCLHFTKNKNFKMYQNAVKVPIGNWTNHRFKSMSERDFIRSASKNNEHLARNVSNWLKKRKVFPHNVIVFEKEHYIETTNVLQFATECANRDHSAVFPLELPSWFIKLFTKKGEIVLDPFIGSGTTAMAAFLLERQYIGIDIDRNFVSKAKKNIKSVKIIYKK
jgi:site-specific DNA-methyltransferase (adenine-specific)